IAVKSVTQKLVVSNLAPSVTQNDVKELFSKIGPVKSAQLNFNEQGKSKGVATVLYQNPGDAAKAYQEYNTRTFDNKPMRIELIVNPESSGFQKLAQVPRQQQGGVNKTRGGRGARRGGRGGRTRSPKVALTSEQLDAEMDSYMNDEVIKLILEHGRCHRVG
ncbi:hypothetical protein EDD86DRAFT_189236, partial [Gorgonomyces haynaldii]